MVTVEVIAVIFFFEPRADVCSACGLTHHGKHFHHALVVEVEGIAQASQGIVIGQSGLQVHIVEGEITWYAFGEQGE